MNQEFIRMRDIARRTQGNGMLLAIVMGIPAENAPDFIFHVTRGGRMEETMKLYHENPVEIISLYKLAASSTAEELRTQVRVHDAQPPVGRGVYVDYIDYAQEAILIAAAAFLKSIWGNEKFEEFKKSVPHRELNGHAKWDKEFREELEQLAREHKL
jgi:hypothetical protein